jgi:hypothetical protein
MASEAYSELFTVLTAIGFVGMGLTYATIFGCVLQPSRVSLGLYLKNVNQWVARTPRFHLMVLLPLRYCRRPSILRANYSQVFC